MRPNRISDETLFKLARRGKGFQIKTKGFQWAYLTNKGIIYRVEWERNTNPAVTGYVDAGVPYIGY